jgi:hypothetical protein
LRADGRAAAVSTIRLILYFSPRLVQKRRLPPFGSAREKIETRLISGWP